MRFEGLGQRPGALETLNPKPSSMKDIYWGRVEGSGMQLRFRADRVVDRISCTSSPIIIITPIHFQCCLHSYRGITPRDGYNVCSYRAKGVADKGAYAPKCFTKKSFANRTAL